MKDCFKRINTANLRFNINFIKKNLKNCKLCAVVKSNAYGHDLDKICDLICDKIDYFAVANNREAIQVRGRHKNVPCLILSPVSKFKLDDAIQSCATFSIQNLHELKLLNNTARKLNKLAYYHLQINSGMNRFGCSTFDEISAIFAHKYSYTRIAGIYSHFGSGATKNDPRTQQQIATFHSLCDGFSNNLIRHFCNSQNAFTHPDAQLDMVRCGLAIYGYGNSNLKPIMNIYAKIIAIQNVKKDDYIGYGLEHKVTHDTRVATIAIGYAKGLPRLWAKDGFVLIHNKKAKIIGNICMEATFIEISDIPAKIGDYVTILSDLPTLNAKTVANSCNTIPYEILTNFRDIPLK